MDILLFVLTPKKGKFKLFPSKYKQRASRMLPLQKPLQKHIWRCASGVFFSNQCSQCACAHLVTYTGVHKCICKKSKPGRFFCLNRPCSAVLCCALSYLGALTPAAHAGHVARPVDRQARHDVRVRVVVHVRVPVVRPHHI